MIPISIFGAFPVEKKSVHYAHVYMVCDKNRALKRIGSFKSAVLD